MIGLRIPSPLKKRKKNQLKKRTVFSLVKLEQSWKTNYFIAKY